MTLASGYIGCIYNNGSSSRAKVATTGLLTAGTAYHVAVSYDGANVAIYINGQSQSLGSELGPLSSGGAGIVRIGATSHSPAPLAWYTGAADDVLFFNRALTPTEILQLYQWRQ
jgi:hypothetical protein